MIVGVSVAIYLREKVRESAEKEKALKAWLLDCPDTDADVKDDKNLYMRINRLITAKLSSRRGPHPSDASL